MRTHGHREGNITHWGLSKGRRAREGITLGEIPNIGEVQWLTPVISALWEAESSRS